MKIALALICKPDDAEAELLHRCLEHASPYVDGIFITQAGKKPNQRVSEVIAEYKGFESFWKWNDSFADARNFNFSQVPKDYDFIFWLDADDVLRGGEKLRDTILTHKDTVDVFSLWYYYAFDEWKNPIVVHHKVRIIKNDGCVSWVGNIHEDFKDNRSITRKHIEGIEVLHLTNVDRVEVSKVRNAHIAKVHLKAYPNDPRSYWNLGNALKAKGDNKGAIKALTTFLKTSQSDDEKYIVRMRLAECFVALDDRLRAVDELRYAIGLKPEYPDAYIALGKLFYDMEKFTEAIPLLKQSLILKPPYYSIVVFNPRDYDYTPMKWLALSYIALNQYMLALPLFEALVQITPRDEKLVKLTDDIRVLAKTNEEMLERYSTLKDLSKEDLRAALDSLPDDWKSHPMFTSLRNQNFIKTESSGKDLVILCGYTQRVWTPDALNEGIGGSEEAVIHLSREFAKAGYNVTVYNNCGHKKQVFDGVTYAPFWTWNYRDKTDITILWRHARMADFEINTGRLFIDLHDVVPEGEFNERRMKRIDKIFVKSAFHRSLFTNISDEKFVIVPNGIVSEDFTEVLDKDPYLLVNTSSPDRSLSALARLFKRVKERVPEAKCEWAYGWDVFDTVHGSNPTLMAWKEQIVQELEAAGIVNRGRVSHKDVADMYKRARIFAYPTEFAEIDCISARKAQAAGALPITTDFAALDETVQFGVKVHSEKTKDTWCKPYQFDFALSNPQAEDLWVDEVVRELSKPLSDTSEMRRWVKQFDWKHIASRWLNELH